MCTEAQAEIIAFSENPKDTHRTHMKGNMRNIHKSRYMPQASHLPESVLHLPETALTGKILTR